MSGPNRLIHSTVAGSSLRPSGLLRLCRQTAGLLRAMRILNELHVVVEYEIATENAVWFELIFSNRLSDCASSNACVGLASRRGFGHV